MNNKANLVKILAVLLIGISLTHTVEASRGDRDRDRNSRDHQSWYHSDQHHGYPVLGRVVVALPSSIITVIFGRSRYQYCDGVFYQRFKNDYVVVAPPIGAVVKSIPFDCQRILIDNNTYYVNNGIYYRYTRRGYEVVTPPSIPVVQTVNVDSTVFGFNPQDIITVNIPNVQGGYTAISLKRTEKGFIGPQGELYTEFPKIEQLKVIYGSSKG